MSAHIMLRCDTCGVTNASPAIPDSGDTDMNSKIVKLCLDGVDRNFKCVWCREKDGEVLNEAVKKSFFDGNARARGTAPRHN